MCSVRANTSAFKTVKVKIFTLWSKEVATTSFTYKLIHLLIFSPLWFTRQLTSTISREYILRKFGLKVTYTSAPALPWNDACRMVFFHNQHVFLQARQEIASYYCSAFRPNSHKCRFAHSLPDFLKPYQFLRLTGLALQHSSCSALPSAILIFTTSSVNINIFVLQADEKQHSEMYPANQTCRVSLERAKTSLMRK